MGEPPVLPTPPRGPAVPRKKRPDPDALTPTQRKILAVLRDGEPHRSADLLLLVDPGGMAEMQQLRHHLSRIRRKLPPHLLLISQLVNVRATRHRLVWALGKSPPKLTGL